MIYGDKLLHLPIIIYNNKKLDYTENYKYLGITIDNKLSFKAHLNYITTKASNFFLLTEMIWNF